ncbi:MAG: alpha/beta fold hydrolase [bacterium]|nr:alpha/beta fold hydrolase [bacterium]
MKLELNSTKESGPAGRTRPPIVILHGLFGSSRNWTSVAKLLADSTDVYALDQRNHGDSPHADGHSLKDLREDLSHWIADQRFSRPPIIIGHSMGGMAAMAFALEYPEALSGLVVVDIAPREYPPHHSKEFEALSIDVSQYSSRSDIDARMQAIVSDRTVRQFLQMNLERKDEGYAWKVNVPALKNATHTSGLENAGAIAGGNQGQFAGPTLFLRGGDSDYIRDEDFGEIERLFAKSEIRTIAGHGHWLHYSAQDEFVAIVREFLAAPELS